MTTAVAWIVIVSTMSDSPQVQLACSNNSPSIADYCPQVKRAAITAAQPVFCFRASISMRSICSSPNTQKMNVSCVLSCHVEPNSGRSAL